MKNIFYICTIAIFITNHNLSNAQSKKEEKKFDLQTLQTMIEQIKIDNPDKRKAENNQLPNQKNKNSRANIPTQYSRNPANIKYSKSTIDNAYKYLSDAEKEKVKNLPAVPEALRTNIDAQIFLDELNGQGIKQALQESAKDKSMALLGYYLTYQSVITKAEYIIRESKKLKDEFIKQNPNYSFGKDIGKTYISENELVYLPLGDASFADAIIDANYINGNVKFPTENCLQTPDYVEAKKVENNKGIYSLGLNGTLTIQFINNALVDVNGADLFVFEAGQIEPTNLEISKNGKNWILVGKIEGGTAAVDIHDFVKPNEYYYYVRLTDLNTASSLAGADIDAVATIGGAMRMSLSAEVLFDVGKYTLKENGIDAIKKLATQLINITNANIMIEGHTDDVGDKETNKTLSLARAESVSTVIQKELGIDKNYEFKEIGKGETEPIAPNNSEENKKKNRRVEIVIIPKK